MKKAINRKWYSFLLIGLILLLAIPLAGCAKSYTGDDLNNAYQQGYATGYQDGYAAGVAERESTPNGHDGETGGEEELLSGAIWWHEAKDHIGERTTVCGPVAGTKYGSTSSGKPTWLNMGKDYPSSERFVVFIWGENRGNFPQPPESYYADKDICVTGLIVEYEGVPEIEVTSPEQIQI